MNHWYESDVYFDPDVFDFKRPDITTANVIAALIIRGVVPKVEKHRGNKKRMVLIQQLKDHLNSSRVGGGAVSISGGGSGGSSGSGAGGSASSSTSKNQGISFNTLVKQHSNRDDFTKLLFSTGASYSSNTPATTLDGEVFEKSVEILEQKDFRPGQFIIASALPDLILQADAISANLFYIFALTKVFIDSSIRLEYINFVTPGAKRPASMIEEEIGSTINVSLPRVLAVKLESVIHQSFVTLNGPPRTEVDPVLPDPRTRGLKEYADSMNNGKIVFTSNKSDVPSRLLKTNMVRRISEEDVLNFIKHTGEVVDIKLESAWARLVSMGEALDDDDSTIVSALPGILRLRLIRILPAASDCKTYVQLLTDGWCRGVNDKFSYDGVCLQRFTNSNLSQASATKVLLSEALINFQHYLVFCFGNIYFDVASMLCESINYGQCYKLQFSMEYVRYEIEKSITDVFNTIRNEVGKAVTDFDITVAVGVRNLLTSKLTGVISKVTIDRQLLFQTNRHLIFPSSTNSSNVSSTNTGALPTSSSVQQGSHCKYFFMGELGVKDNKKNVFKCTVSACKFTHATVDTMTYTEATQCLDEWKLKKLVTLSLANKIQSAIESTKKRKAFKP